MIARFWVLLAAAFVAATPASAHPGTQALHGFTAGFAHPLAGFDHVLAMVAVGLWAGLVGGRALWAWPFAFASLLIGGALLAVAGLSLPRVEFFVALSVVLSGLAVTAQASIPVLLGAFATAAFALFHGFAHGTELNGAADLASAVAGFSVSTVLLHGAGIVLAVGSQRLSAAWLPRAAGGAVAAVGLAFLIG